MGPTSVVEVCFHHFRGQHPLVLPKRHFEIRFILWNVLDKCATLGAVGRKMDGVLADGRLDLATVFTEHI